MGHKRTLSMIIVDVRYGREADIRNFASVRQLFGALTH